jgi:hypothetical protein
MATAPPLAAEQDPLRFIPTGTSREIGERFSLVDNLARALGTHGAWVTEYLPDDRRLRALAFRWVRSGSKASSNRSTAHPAKP